LRAYLAKAHRVVRKSSAQFYFSEGFALLLRGKPFLLSGMRKIVSLILLFSALVMAQEIKKKEWKVSVHLESENRTEGKLTFPVKIEGKNVPFSKSALFTQKDIDRARIFRNADGSVGVVFRIEKRAAKSLYNLEYTHKGKRLATLLMGRQVDVIQIDKARQDRLFVIWKGLTMAEVDYIEAEIKPLQPDDYK